MKASFCVLRFNSHDGLSHSAHRSHVYECVSKRVRVSVFDHSRYLCRSSSSVRSTTSGGGTQPDCAETDVHWAGALCFQEESDWITPPRGNLETTLKITLQQSQRDIEKLNQQGFFWSKSTLTHMKALRSLKYELKVVNSWQQMLHLVQKINILLGIYALFAVQRCKHSQIKKDLLEYQNEDMKSCFLRNWT